MLLGDVSKESLLTMKASRVLPGKSNVHVTRETGQIDEGQKEKASADPGEGAKEPTS